MKVKVETDMMHDNMEMDLVCSASHIQKIKMEYEETGIANTTEGIKFLIGKKDTNQSGRMGGNLCSKKDVKVRVGAKDGIDTVRVNRALISKKSQGTGVSISVSFEHKCRLRRLLKKLLSLREWKGAAGVLGTLLKGTCKDRLSLKNRRKYWASLELLGRIGVSSSSLWKLERIYEIWMSKQPWGSRTLRKKKYLIQLEVALLLLMEAKLEDACNITKFLVQEPESRNEPFVHMVHGLILYQLWYASIPEELQLTHVRHQAAAPSSADLLYVPYNDSKPVEALDPGNAVDNLKEWASGYNSENSIGNFKGACNGTHDKSSKNKQFRGSCPLKLYMDGVADMNLDTNLLPMKIQNLLRHEVDPLDSCRTMVNELFKDAVKHLQLALSSNPPMFAALTPLVQLLLLGGQVEDALDVLKNFSLNSEHSIPSRLRAYLLGHLCSKNLNQLCACHEDALRKDPTSRDSLIHLIKMHESGNYAMEMLIEMITLHLDATCGTSYVWQHLAMLLLKVQTQQFQYEDHQFSTERSCKGNRRLPSFMLTSSLPKMFFGKLQKKAWKLRCRWWSTHHFSRKTHIAENQAGDLQLLTFKGACAAHFFGRSFEYVAYVYSDLKNRDDKDRTVILEKHMESCLDLQNKLNRK